MTNFIGLVVEEIERIGNSLRGQAQNEVAGVIRAIDQLVQTAEQNWKGNDLDQFRDQWQHTHRPNLLQLQEHIDTLGQKALTHAQHQRDISQAL